MINREIGNSEYRRKLIKIGIIVVIIGILFCIISALHNLTMPVITLKVKNQSMIQDEEMPVIEVKASCKGDKKTILDKKSKYTVGDFVRDLNKGKGYKLKHKVDETKDNIYPVSILLDKKMEEKVHEKWYRKIKFKIENGTFEVKNKYGEWEKDKFKKWDGTYVISDFMVSGGKTYFFDKDGKMVTGKMTRGRTEYVFRKDGSLKSKEDKIDSSRPMVALTFDDGPGQYTDTLLAELEKQDARATFFMLGKNAVNYPDTIKKMEKLGCELGNHSTTHTSLKKLNDAGVRYEIDTTDAAISNAVGQRASVLRPPYGDMNEHIRSISGKPFVMWSLDTLDWKRRDAAQITEYVLNNVTDGDIILLHDIHDFSVEATIALIPQLIEQGYQLVTVSEMAEARGIEMVNGKKYFNFYPN